MDEPRPVYGSRCWNGGERRRTAEFASIRVGPIRFGSTRSTWDTRVVGDRLYGAGREKGFSGNARPWAVRLAREASRQFLHAAELRFRHPITSRDLEFTSPLPGDLSPLRDWALSTES